MRRTNTLLMIALLLSACSREWQDLPELDRSISLAGEWKIRFIDQEPTDWEDGVDVPVPGPWEVVAEGAGYDGVAWYMRRFTVPQDTPAGAAVSIRFEAVNYGATVFLDGKEAARHEGGYSPFDITIDEPRVGHEYQLVVRVADPGEAPVDDWTLDAIPHAKESWYYNYGGIVGDVTLEIHGPLYVKDLFAVLGNRISFTVENLTGRSQDVMASLEIREPGTERIVFEKEDDFTCSPGVKTMEWEVGELAGLKTWTLESPQLYEVKVLVEGAGFRHSLSDLTGVRTFELDEEGFRLNGEPLFVRAVLYQPYYPGTLCRPPDDDWVKREVGLMKEAGFNMVRAHIRPAPESFLDECDRQGLLVMAEPAIGWIREETPGMEARVTRAVESLVRGQRNHVSIVMWGMLNELSGSVYPLREALMQKARALDPTRVITDDSAGWTGKSLYLPPFETEPREYGDYHVYLNYPLDNVSRRSLQSLGQDRKGPVFISEFGFGGMTDLPAAVEFFKGRMHLEDASQYARILEQADLPMGNAFRTWQEMEAVACEVQFEAALTLGAAFINHPRVAGYCYTQFQDASWELSAGLTDIMGRPKERAFKALKKVNSLSRGDQPPLPPVPRTRASKGEVRKGRISTMKLPGEAVALLKKKRIVTDGAPVMICGGVLTLARPDNVREAARLYRFVKQGGVLVYLKPPRLDSDTAMLKLGTGHEGIAVDLPLSLHYRRVRGGFVGRFHYVDQSQGLFKGFNPNPRYLGRGFGDVLPDTSYLPLGTEESKVPIGSFDCFGEFLGGDLAAVRYGKGWFVFSHFKLLENLKRSPMAPLVLDRVIEFALGLASDEAGADEGFAPPSRAESDAVTRALNEVRRTYSFFERMAALDEGGKRKRKIVSPHVRALDDLRRQGLEKLVEGDYSESARLLQEVPSRLDDRVKRMLEAEDRFIRTAESTDKPRYQEAKRLFAAGEYDAAIRLIN